MHKCKRAVAGACSNRSRSEDADGAGPPSLIARFVGTKKSEKKNQSKKHLENRVAKNKTKSRSRSVAREMKQRHRRKCGNKQGIRVVPDSAHRS